MNSIYNVVRELNSCWNRTPVLMSEKRYQLHVSKRITSLTSNIYYVCVWICMALQSRKSSRTVQCAIYVDQDNKKPAYIFFYSSIFYISQKNEHGPFTPSRKIDDGGDYVRKIFT